MAITQRPARSLLVDNSNVPLNFDGNSPVVLPSVDITGSVTSAAVLFTQDMTDYQSLSLQVISIASSLIVVEWSNDNTTWFAGDVKRSERLEAGLVQVISAAGLWICPRRGKYVRARVSFYGGGGTAVQVQANAMSITVDIDNWQGSPLPFSVRSAAAASGLTAVKTSAGVIKSLDVSNSGASARWVKIFDETSVTMGTTSAMREYYLPPSSARQIAISAGGLRFSNAIRIAITAAAGLTDNTVASIGAGEVLVNGEYA